MWILLEILAFFAELFVIPLAIEADREPYPREGEAAVGFLLGVVIVLLCSVGLMAMVHGRWSLWVTFPMVVGFFFAGVLGIGWVAAKYAAIGRK